MPDQTSESPTGGNRQGFQENQSKLTKKGLDMDNMSYSDGNSKLPVVFERDGRVFANSRNVAEYFGKRHDNVMRDIRNLIADAGQWGVLNFEETPYVDPQNGQSYQTYDMTRDGFSLLAMGFTGAKALGFKLRYIEQFNAMEATLRNPLAGFAIPQTLPEALRLAADQQERIAEQARQIEGMTPKVFGFDRIANADGTMCITDAAKALQIRPKDLFGWLLQNGWIYGRQGKAGYLAYQDKIQAGYLEHKVTTVYRNDGSEKITEAVRVTPKGLSKLSLLVPGAKRPGAPTLEAAE